MLASAIPRKNRATISVAKFLVAAWHASIMAQIKLGSNNKSAPVRISMIGRPGTYNMIDRDFPSGNLIKINETGYVAKR
jgi:hypothetical protein